MRGVLLVVLLFMLSSRNREQLETKIGENILPKYIHMFELTTLLECWLDRDSFTRSELEIGEQFILIFTQNLVMDIKRENGSKWKLPKIHQLRHFIPQIREFGCASNINGQIGKANLKEKVKCPAQWTCMQAQNFEIQTAMQDIDRCVIHKASCDIIKECNSMLSKYIGAFKDATCKGSGENILGARWDIIKDDNNNCSLRAQNISYRQCTWKGPVEEEEILSYIDTLGVFKGFLHTDYKAKGIRYHGNPLKGWHDWVKVMSPNGIIMCHVLMFLHVTAIPITSDSNLQEETYALVHFVNEDVFTDEPIKILYGHKYADFFVDGNCHLVRGWVKKTRLSSCKVDLISNGAV